MVSAAATTKNIFTQIRIRAATCDVEKFQVYPRDGKNTFLWTNKNFEFFFSNWRSKRYYDDDNNDNRNNDNDDDNGSHNNGDSDNVDLHYQ